MKAEERPVAAMVAAAAVTAAATMETTEMVPVKKAAWTGVETGSAPADRKWKTENARTTFQPRPVPELERNDGERIALGVVLNMTWGDVPSVAPMVSDHGKQMEDFPG